MLLREVLKSAIPEPVSHKISDIHVPMAKFDLGNGEAVIASPVSLLEVDDLKRPLVETWPELFSVGESRKWFDGREWIKFYDKKPGYYEGLPCAGSYEDRIKLFALSVYLRTYDEEILPLAARVLSFNSFSPSTIKGEAFAVSPNYRGIGIGDLLATYSKLAFYGISETLLWDTNSLDSQVSGGRSPVNFWKRHGTMIGRMENYGTSDSEIGDGILFFASVSGAIRENLNTKWSILAKTLINLRSTDKAI